MRPIVLLLFAASLLGQEEEGLVFGKKPVVCAPIECEVRVPNGWTVAQDHTGLSAQGDGFGFVITREPLLESEKTFAKSWERTLSDGGVVAKVSSARAGRYKAFRAEWEPKKAAGRVIEVYRVHVTDQEMLYNVSFSFPKDADREPLLKGVLKSFKCTSKKMKLVMQKTRFAIGSAASFQLPLGFEAKKDPRWRGGWYVRARKGYDKPEQAGVVYTASFSVGARFPDGGTTSKPEDVNKYLLGALSQRGMKFGEKFKTKAATYGGLKGDATTGEVRGTDGETYELYVWTGKGKRQTASVILVIHERELRVHKKYFSIVLRTLKAAR
jgi:hypothetical protein